MKGSWRAIFRELRIPAFHSSVRKHVVEVLGALDVQRAHFVGSIHFLNEDLN